jgi:hypothetical protein
VQINVPTWVGFLIAAVLCAGVGAGVALLVTDGGDGGGTTTAVATEEIVATATAPQATATAPQATETAPGRQLGQPVVDDLVDNGTVDRWELKEPPRPGWDVEYVLRPSGYSVLFRRAPDGGVEIGTSLVYDTPSNRALDAAVVQAANNHGFPLAPLEK